MGVWVYQYPSLQAKTASELGHGDVAILNPHMWSHVIVHEHTIYQTKFKVKQTETELKIKTTESIKSILQAGCDEVFMEFHSQRSHYDCDS